MTCPCSSAFDDDAAAEFLDLYGERFGTDPGVYALETFDITSVFLRGLKSAEEGDSAAAARRTLLRYLAGPAPKEGITKTYAWTRTGELQPDPAYVFLYEWSAGVQDFVLQGDVEEVLAGAKV